MLGTILYAYYSVAVNENFSTETRVKKYCKTHREIDEKTLEKLHQKEIKKKNLSQKCDFKNIVYVPRYGQKT